MLASVRARTTAVAAVVTAVVLIGGSVALLATLHGSLVRGDDALARARLHDLVVLAQRGELPERVDAGDGLAQVVDAGGGVLVASANVAGRPPVSSYRPTGEGAVVRTLVGPDDTEREQYRVWIQRAESPDGEVVAYVGTSTESVREATRTVRRTLLVGVPLVLLLLVGATWMLLGRALRPVEAIRAEVAEITDRRLDRRVPVPDVEDEIGRLARTMNAMLDRLEDGSLRQRAFVADVSHELQSPLAAMRALLEVDGDRPAEETRRLLAEVGDMEALVQNLLFLAREDAGATGPHALLDLDDLVLEEAARLRPGATVAVDTAGVSGAPVLGDAADLRRLVRNLLENAVRHARSTVRVGLTAGTDGVVLDVRDDGGGVAAEDRDRIFDRFHKADPARRRGGSGSGLGLPIARAVAEAHGGTVALVAEPGGAHFRVRLPAPP